MLQVLEAVVLFRPVAHVHHSLEHKELAKVPEALDRHDRLFLTPKLADP